MAGGYTVDLDELDNLTARLRGYQGFLTENLDELERRVRALSSTWSGVAAGAFAAAHRDWEMGVTDVKEGLQALEATAVRAHTSYSDAVAANLKMVGRRR